MTQLRDDFTTHMTVQRLSDNTKQSYLNAVKGLAKYYNYSPDKLTEQLIQQYLYYLIEERKLAWNTCNVALAAFSCFFNDFLGWKSECFSFLPSPRDKKLPEVLSVDEVKRIMDSTSNVKHLTLFMTVYCAGLRVSEVVHLMPEHIESDRMMIRVNQGKGRKDRYTILTPDLLEQLRIYWTQCHPDKWLFPGNAPQSHMSRHSALRAFNQAKKRAAITKGKGYGIHLLRHCFATHLLEQGVDLFTLKSLLGHTKLETTAKYVQISQKRITAIKSPLMIASGNSASC